MHVLIYIYFLRCYVSLKKNKPSGIEKPVGANRQMKERRSYAVTSRIGLFFSGFCFLILQLMRKLFLNFRFLKKHIMISFIWWGSQSHWVIACTDVIETRRVSFWSATYTTRDGHVGIKIIIYYCNCRCKWWKLIKKS